MAEACYAAMSLLRVLRDAKAISNSFSADNMTRGADAGGSGR